MAPESRNRGLAVPRPKPSVHLPGCLPTAYGPAHLGATLPPLRAYPLATYQLRSGTPSRSTADRLGRAAGLGVVSTSNGGVASRSPSCPALVA
eukprot:COSAG02_NODE_157_length_32999_cov_31.863647_5_plen_93_part_00